jgi:hypothetical protein
MQMSSLNVNVANWWLIRGLFFIEMSKNEVEKQLAFEKLDGLVGDIVNKAQYSELYGYDLTAIRSDQANVIRERLLRKFLQANDYDVEEAKSQLVKTLQWRKKFNPLSAAFKETHKSDFEKLGIVTNVKNDGHNLVTTWNLYGAIENRQQLFADLDGFLRWRVGLMEQGLSLLDFTNESESYMTQIHDYNNVSILRVDSATRAATKATIEVFRDYYPELLSSKFFVNVPTIMGWMFTFVKPFLPKETLAKFHVVSNGLNLAAEIGRWVPSIYGGNAKSLDDLRISCFSPRNPDLCTKVGSEQKTDDAQMSVTPVEGKSAGEKSSEEKKLSREESEEIAVEGKPVEEVAEKDDETVEPEEVSVKC